MTASTIRYYVAASLDGFIAAPDGTFDNFINDDAFNADMFARLQAEFDSVVMGRATYEVGLKHGVTNPYPWLRTYVVSTSMDAAPAPEVSLLRSVDEVAQLKASGEAGRIWLCGGGELASALLSRGLIDELEVKRHPVWFGEGIPMFRDSEQSRWSPVADPRTWASGIEVRRYRTEASG